MSQGTLVYDLIASMKVNEDEITSFCSLFAYEGFNPQMVHEHFAKIKNEKGIDDTAFKKDLMTLMVLGAMKGNYTEKNSSKISDEGKVTADNLYTKYSLKKGSVGKDKKAVTLPRILSAFPTLATKVVVRAPSRVFGPKSKDFPKVIMNPVFASLVPTSLPEETKKGLLKAYTTWSAEQTMALTKTSDFAAAYDKQDQYTAIAHASSVPSEKMRVSVFLVFRVSIISCLSALKAAGCDVSESDLNALS